MAFVRLLVLVVALLISSSVAWARVSRGTIEQVLAPLVGQGGDHVRFSIERCPVPVGDVTRFILTGLASTHELRFRPGCDLEGTFPLDTRPAQVDFRVRHLGRVTRIRGLLSSEAGAVTGAQFGIITRLDDGELTLEGHGLPAGVTAEYEVGFPGVLSLAHPTVASGTLRVTSFDGEQVHFKAPLTVESKHSSGLQSPHVGEGGDTSGCGNSPDCYGRVRAR